VISKEEFIQHHIFTEQILRKKSILKYSYVSTTVTPPLSVDFP